MSRFFVIATFAATLSSAAAQRPPIPSHLKAQFAAEYHAAARAFQQAVPATCAPRRAQILYSRSPGPVYLFAPAPTVGITKDVDPLIQGKAWLQPNGVWGVQALTISGWVQSLDGTKAKPLQPPTRSTP